MLYTDSPLAAMLGLSCSLRKGHPWKCCPGTGDAQPLQTQEGFEIGNYCQDNWVVRHVRDETQLSKTQMLRSFGEKYFWI